MKSRGLLEITAAASALAVVVVGGLLIHSPGLQAQNQGNDDESKIKRGFEIAPVRLDIA